MASEGYDHPDGDDGPAHRRVSSIYRSKFPDFRGFDRAVVFPPIKAVRRVFQCDRDTPSGNGEVSLATGRDAR
jgi:hypothetical protein